MIRKTMFCNFCKTDVLAIVEFGFDGAGYKVRELCPNSGKYGMHRVGKTWGNTRNYSVDNWSPPDFDTREHICEICGSKDRIQEHHLAPREFYKDADKYPTIYLCGFHHDLWHELTFTGSFSSLIKNKYPELMEIRKKAMEKMK